MIPRLVDPDSPLPAAAGIGLRAVHHAEIVAARPGVGWVEAHAENYMGRGIPFHYLAKVREQLPVSLHGVGASIGSAEGIDVGHLDRLKDLVDAIEPALVSEHLSWSVVDGVYLNDLLPLPLTEEMLVHVARQVDRVQSRLGRRILIENPSSYLRYTFSTISEGEFLAELARRSGCGLLCDVNNLHVVQNNLGHDALSVLDALPAAAVGEIHVAGHHVADRGDVTILIDDHGAPVAEPVWALYAEAVRRFPHAATLVEWDTRIPPLARLVAEAHEADGRRAAALEAAPDVVAA